MLARPVGVEGAGGPGTKGLSLFIVPKYEFDPETGELGDRNGVYATGVEHKMGLKVSTTCEMTFGDKHPAKGWLMGEKHEGIRQMFLIIEYARMMVGTKAIATLSTGYLNALEYAKSRVQGADLLQATDKTAPRVTITHHPDVRRSLLLQKSYAEGLRALVCYTATWQDKARIAVAEDDAETNTRSSVVNDLLLPLIKGCGSERAYELLSSESLQTFGGSGFLEDYPLEQYVRDSKIDSLYEGTTAIQSLDLVFRKIVKDGGVALGTVAGEIGQFLSADGPEDLKALRASLGDALENTQAMLGSLGRGHGRLPARRPTRAVQGRAALAASPSRHGRCRHRVAARPPGRDRTDQAERRRPQRRRHGLLHRQGRGREILRRRSPASTALRPQDRRSRRPHRDGHPGRGVLVRRSKAPRYACIAGPSPFDG